MGGEGLELKVDRFAHQQSPHTHLRVTTDSVSLQTGAILEEK